MTQFWEMCKSMMGWWLGPEKDQYNCDYHDDDEGEVQESSGVGTIIVIYTALAGLFIAANIIPRQLTQDSQTLRDREMCKDQQQRRRSKHAANAGNKRLRKKLVLDNLQVAVQPTVKEAQWPQLMNSTKANAKELYFDLTSENNDDFVEAKDY